MKFASVCSGIEAATVALQPLGFKPVFYSEIHRPTNRFLAAKFPDTPNYGDINHFEEWPDHRLDLLVGGTPCQSFSLRGDRGGLEDSRGQITRSFFEVIGKYRPQWIVWENVFGVLSSNGGKDFGSFLGALAERGYGFSYRVLDARYFGLAARRIRVYLVGYLGSWEGPAKVLFEPGGCYGVAPEKRATPEGIAKCITRGTGRRFDAETETFVVDDWGVRRLMPIECERLLGFPDGFTNVSFPDRNPTSDTFRYEALGNSMAVPVLRWIGQRILDQQGASHEEIVSEMF